MHYKTPADRNQVLLGTSMDSWVAHDNPVRLIDAVVDSFVEENDFSCPGKEKKGCTSYSPATMLKLILYCYYNWIPGSRRIEKETHRNLEVIWLIGGLRPDHWTICKFRRENKEGVRSCAIALRKFLYDNGYIVGKSISFDGSKMKAYASRDMLSEDKLKGRIENIEQLIDKYLDNAEETDQLEEALENEAGKNKALKEKIEKLEKRKTKYEKAKEQLKSSGKKIISPNDPDAGLMKGRDGKMACYNVQTGVDQKYHMIVLAEATSEVCDIGLLKPNLDALKDQLGIAPGQILADKGYGNVNQIKEIEGDGQKSCYIPLMEPESKKKDKENNIGFSYNEDDCTYTCPNGKKLTLVQKNYKKRSHTYNKYRCKECGGCPIRRECTTSKTGRSILVNTNNKWIQEHKRWVGANMETVKKRKTIVEHPYGTIKFMMGELCFLLTGKDKVQIETDIYSTAYNLKRLINIENMSDLIEKVKNHNWKSNRGILKNVFLTQKLLFT